MRLKLAAAAAALLCIAPPAAAQQDALTIVTQAVERLRANHPDAVEDYTLVLEHDGMRVPAYVYRDGDEWAVSTPEDSPINELIGAAVMWPVMTPTSDEALEEMLADDETGEVTYGGTARVHGRLAHVLAGRLTDADEMLDSLSLYVDAQNHQLLRMTAAGMMEGDGSEFLGEGAAMRMVVDLADYTSHGGLTVPMRINLRMSLDFQMSDQERQALRVVLDQVLSMARSDPDSMEEEELAALELFARMFADGELDLPVTVTDVQVNSGPPEWM